ncbi:HAD-like domain-containing protein, partial [Paraphysoderma sedebokerense]
VLLDCDGTLVDSESLAFSGCCDVVNELLLRKNVAKTYEWKKLKQEFVGCSFRSIVEKLGQMYSFSLAHGELDQLAREEDERVTSVLKKKVELCDGVMDAIVNLKSNGSTPIAVVSSSSLPRVRACLQKTDLDRHIPPNQVYSAVSSLPVPKSKPDPEVYLYALQDMGMRCEQCFAVEDSVNGTLAAVGAGIDVIGYVGSLEHEERATASAELMNAGAFIVITHWDDF